MAYEAAEAAAFGIACLGSQRARKRIFKQQPPGGGFGLPVAGASSAFDSPKPLNNLKTGAPQIEYEKHFLINAILLTSFVNVLPACNRPITPDLLYVNAVDRETIQRAIWRIADNTL